MSLSTRMPTLDEVAREAGVSRSTASRAINGGNRVSPAAQAAVDAAVAHLGFTPNRAARALVTQQSGSVALVIPEPDELFLSDPFLLGVLRGVSLALSGTDVQLVLLIAHAHQPIDRMTQFLRAGHVDGAIIASPHREDRLEEALRGRFPVVFIGRPFESDGLTFVDVDNAAGSRLGAQVLVDAGCTRIATVSGPLDMTAGIDRLAGWRDALVDAGMPTDARVEADFTVDGAERATERLLAEHPDVDGIFIASDLMAIGVRRALDAAGRAVPGDVSLVGFDALGADAAMSPKLTTVVNPVAEMTLHATRLLLERISDPTLPAEGVVLPTRVEPGASVR